MKFDIPLITFVLFANAVSLALAQGCKTYTRCGDCLTNECSWAVGRCMASCGLVADTYCLDSEFISSSPADACADMDTLRADEQRCSSKTTGCSSCIATTKSDGSSCEWYGNRCGTGGCDLNGKCGENTCPNWFTWFFAMFRR
jgi:hypothetical protein